MADEALTSPAPSPLKTAWAACRRFSLGLSLSRFHTVVGTLAGIASIGGVPVLFAASYAPTDKVAERLGRSSMALLAELNQGFHYVGSIPALLGLWWTLGLVRRRPGKPLPYAGAAPPRSLCSNSGRSSGRLGTGIDGGRFFPLGEVCSPRSAKKIGKARQSRPRFLHRSWRQ